MYAMKINAENLSCPLRADSKVAINAILLLGRGCQDIGYEYGNSQAAMMQPKVSSQLDCENYHSQVSTVIYDGMRYICVYQT